MIVEQQPSRIIHAARSSGTCGSTNRIGREICGAIRSKDFALVQRVAHQAQLAVLQIAQAAVNQLAARGRCRAGEIALLAQRDAQSASRPHRARCRRHARRRR
jgi:hypothetical protein